MAATGNSSISALLTLSIRTRVRRLALATIVGLGPAIGLAAQSTPPQQAAAGALVQQAATEIARLERDIAALEASWTTQFVGRLTRNGVPIAAGVVLDPLRRAQREVDGLRRDLQGPDTGPGRGAAPGAGQIERYADAAEKAAFERWQLRLTETALGVELAGQEYEAVAAEARGARPAQREAAIRRELEARTSATRSLAVVRERFQLAHKAVLQTLGAIEESLRRAGRTSAADALEARMDTRLNVTAAGDTVRTDLDRFLSAQTIVIESPLGEDWPEPLTLSGALAPVDLGVAPTPAATLDVVRFAPGAVGYEHIPELGFGRGLRLELTFDREPGGGSHDVTVQWNEGSEPRTLTIPIASGNGKVHYSDLVEIWPAGTIEMAPLQTAPATPGRRGGIPDLDGDSAEPAAPATSAAAGPDWRALETPIKAEIARLTAALQVTPAVLSEPELRARIRAGRVTLADLGQSLSTAPPPADSPAFRALGAFRATWEGLAEAVWTARPPAETLDANRWATLRATFKDAACRDLVPRMPVRLDGLAWACVIDGFFRELVRLEGLVDGATVSLREAEIAPLRQSVADMERALAAGTAAGEPLVSASRARLEATEGMLKIDLKVARLRSLDLERRRALASDASSPYGWFLAWSATTTSAPSWRRAPYVLRANPGSVVRVTFGGATIERVVERNAPVDLPAFFARAIHDAHDQTRRMATDASRFIELELVEYEASLDRRFAAAIAVPDGAALRQQAVEARRQELVRNSTGRLTAAGARLQRARQLAMTAIEGAR